MTPAVADLARRFDACMRPHGSPPPLPTERSVRAIEEHFGFSLPATLLALAKTATSFGGWFASLGEDFTSPTHIIRLNSYWRRRRKTRAIPRNLVIINLGFDEDLDCLDIGHGCGGDYPVQYWSPGVPDGRRYPGFQAYLEALLAEWPAIERHDADNVPQGPRPTRRASEP